MKTIIEWKSILNQLPPIDVNYNAEYDDVYLFSIPVYGTDGFFINWIRYIHNWDKLERCKKNYNSYTKEWYGPLKWVDAEMGPNYFHDADYWCFDEDVILPQPINQEIVSDDNKRYNLKQLRQAWGKGFHDGQQQK